MEFDKERTLFYGTAYYILETLFHANCKGEVPDMEYLRTCLTGGCLALPAISGNYFDFVSDLLCKRGYAYSNSCCITWDGTEFLFTSPEVREVKEYYRM